MANASPEQELIAAAEAAAGVLGEYAASYTLPVETAEALANRLRDAVGRVRNRYQSVDG